MLTVTLATGAAAQPAGGGPTVTGPITGGHGVPLVFAHTTFDLGTVGYTQSEFFLERHRARRTRRPPRSPATGSGRSRRRRTAAFKTRIVVYRPINQRDFNGTVVVEWLNVSGGADASPDWMHTHDELIREGYAWVGVSAQAVGVNGLNRRPAHRTPRRHAATRRATRR